MKKQTLSLALALVLTIALVPAVSTTAQAAEPWQDAYAAFLGNVRGNNTKFGLTDMDGNGIPELILYNEHLLECTVYIYANGKMTEFGPYGGGTSYWAYPYEGGIYTEQRALPGADLALSYWTVQDNRMIETPPVKGAENSFRLECYTVTAANIQDMIYGSGATANTNPHPYATALREFMAGGGETEAWLADINGDGVQAMLAHKDIARQGGGTRPIYRLYYIYNAKLNIQDWECPHDWFDAYSVYFSSNGYLIASVGDEHYYSYIIYSIISGELKGVKVSEDTALNGVRTYYHNDNEITKAQYDGYLKQYGIGSGGMARPDETAQILAMTAEPGTTPLITPHPFATALREFNRDAKSNSETAAWLANMGGGEVMLAHITDTANVFSKSSKTRFFYLQDGKVNTKDWTDAWDAEGGSYQPFISSKNYFIRYKSDMWQNGAESSITYYAHSFTGGELKQEAELREDFHPDAWFFNGQKITKAEYDAYLNQYGITLNAPYRSPKISDDQTAQILAMTAAPANPLAGADTWAHSHISEANAKGFLPAALQDNYKQNITRGDFVALAMSWLNYKTGKTNDQLVTEFGKFPDRTFTDTTDPVILAAARLDITAGIGNGQFGVGGTFNRQQAAVMLTKVFAILGTEVGAEKDFGFADLDTADNWARNAVNFVGNNDVMSGKGGGLFAPHDTFQRQESIIVFNKMG